MSSTRCPQASAVNIFATNTVTNLCKYIFDFYDLFKNNYAEQLKRPYKESRNCNDVNTKMISLKDL